MQKNSILERVFADVFMVLIIAWAPWWIIIIATFFFLFRYNSYYEIIFWGLCLDEIYGVGHVFPYSLSATMIACVLFAGSALLKKRLMFY